MKKFLLTLSITILIPLLVDFPQSHARPRPVEICDNLCQAKLICNYYVDAYWNDQTAFDVAVLGSGNELVQLYCVFQQGLIVVVPNDVIGAIDKDGEIKVSNASSMPKEKAGPNDPDNQKDTDKATAENDIAPGNNPISKTKVATLTD